MKGSIRQLTPRSFQIQVYTGKTPDGKYKRAFETFRGKKGDAQKRLNELLVNLEKGIPTPAGRLTVAEHLHQWIEGYVKTNCSARTLDAIQSIAVHHLIPALGHIQLKQLQAPTIQTYYGKACEKLSARSVHYHHRILKQSLKYAVRQGYLGRNPCDMVDPPSPHKKSMRTLTPGELEILLDNASGDRFYPCIYTGVSTGLRQAELLGLSWRDIDLDYLSVSVNKTLYKRRGVCQFQETKTEHSRRRVSMTPKLALYLKEYRKERETIYLERGQILGLDSLVFASPDGKPFDPGVLSHTFHKIVKRAGLANVRFHDLRHTFASLMFLKGAKPKVISEALGHASVAFTMDVYSHIIEGMQQDAMALLDEVLPAGKHFNANLTQISSVMSSKP